VRVCGRANRVPTAARGKPTCAQCHNPLPWLVAAGDADFDRVVVEADLPVLLDLWAPCAAPVTRWLRTSSARAAPSRGA
jgi:thioredoxin 2